MRLAEKFFHYLSFEKHYSPHTLISYRIDLIQFFTFLNVENDSDKIRTITHKEIRRWIIKLMQEGISARSVNRKISSLKAFYKFLMRKQLIDIDPTNKVIPPKNTTSLPEFLHTKDLIKLLDETDFGNTFTGKRDKIILEILFGTGIRLSELKKLTIADIDLSKPTIKVLGKGNKERILPINNTLKFGLEKYLAIRIYNFGHTNPFLLLTKKGEKVYEKLIYRVVKKWLSQITTKTKKSPHILRHSFATALLNNGAELNAIRELLGHSNLLSTQVYTHNTFEKIKKMYKQAHPRAQYQEGFK